MPSILYKIHQLLMLRVKCFDKSFTYNHHMESFKLLFILFDFHVFSQLNLCISLKDSSFSKAFFNRGTKLTEYRLTVKHNINAHKIVSIITVPDLHARSSSLGDRRSPQNACICGEAAAAIDVRISDG